MDEQNSTGGKDKIAMIKKLFSEQKTFVWIGAVAVVLLVLMACGAYKVYAKTATDKFSLAIAKALHLPAVKVGDKNIPYTAFAEDLKAIHIMRDYDKSQRDTGISPDRSPGADLTEDQMTDQVLWRLVNSSLISEAAKKYDVTVEDKDVRALKEQMLQQFKDEDAANAELVKRYGWDLKVYEQKVMRPFILQTKLAQKMKDDPKTKEELRQNAEKVLEEVKNGGDFAALAKKYNEDSTRETGGDLGWFGRGEMVPEFEKAVYSLKKGEIYPTLVESVYGYHVIRLDDKKTERVKNDKGQMVNAERVRASQVLFRFPDLLSYLDKMTKSGEIHLYLKIHNPFAEPDSSSDEAQDAQE